MDSDAVEETFSEWKSEVLKELRPFLVDKLESQKLFAHLRSFQVIDDDDQEDIEAERTRRRRNERLLDVIRNRGPEAFDGLCEAIRQNVTQLFILTKILNSFQKKRDTFSELTMEPSSQIFPVPGGPGGPVVPYYEMPEENILATRISRSAERPRSPPPAYSEF